MAKAARISDLHTCPKTGHTINAIESGEDTVLINGLPAATVGSVTSCGATIITGSSSVTINGKPAALIGSATSHGGVIVSGSGNVFIGDMGPSSLPGISSSSIIESLLIYDEQVQFTTPVSTHMVGLAYFIESEDGINQSGVIGPDGLLPRISTQNKAGSYTVYWGDDAMEKSQA